MQFVHALIANHANDVAVFDPFLLVNYYFSGDTTPGTPPSSHGSGVALSTLAEDSEDEGRALRRFNVDGFMRTPFRPVIVLRCEIVMIHILIVPLVI